MRYVLIDKGFYRQQVYNAHSYTDTAQKYPQEIKET